MLQITDKIIIWIFGILLAVQMKDSLISVLIVLIALIAGAFVIYIQNRKAVTGIWAVYLLLCVMEPSFTFFLPLLFYDSVRYRIYWGALGIIPMYLAREIYEGWQIALWILVSVMAVIMAEKTKQVETLKSDIIHLRDTSTELNLIMSERNRELMEKQDYEIHLATLRERNRIAREIHDHVGHMLSRSILQMGALATVYKEEPIHQQLISVNNTLNMAMNNIRESVHDLHDDAIDLKQAVLEATREIRESYDFHFEYDMTEPIPRKVKYCLIATVKEAMSNIVKHSNADKIQVVFREHPGFYQLSIEDNGTTIKKNRESGIGLINMRERVEALNGTIHIYTEKGFRIKITIQKVEGRDENNHCG